MKRYIRLKNGKIFDLTECCKESENTIIDKHSNWLNEKDIVAESDTITDLIMVGDLLEWQYLNNHDCGLDIWHTSCVESLKDNSMFYDDMNVRKIYTKQGNDYILVARETENEWEII